MSLEIKDVAFGYRNHPGWRDLNFSLKDASRLVLMGRSGEGKSTLLKLIAGLLTPLQGSIRIYGKSLLESRPAMSFVFQGNALFDSMSVEDNLIFPQMESCGSSPSQARRVTDELLEAVGLKGFSRHSPGELSGGMQKRLGLARALCVRPKILICDEPTAGLDPITSHQIADLIVQQCIERNIFLISATSDLQRSYQMGQELVLLLDGQLLATGSPEQTRTHPDSRVQTFLYGSEPSL